MISGCDHGSGGAKDWRHAKGSYGVGNCVDVSSAFPMASGACWGVWVADSVLPNGQRLYFMRDDWMEFIGRVKNDCAVLQPAGT